MSNEAKFWVEDEAKMFMIIDSFDLGILEKQWWVKSVDFFAGKYYFFSRFCGIRIKRHFPLSSPFGDGR